MTSTRVRRVSSNEGVRLQSKGPKYYVRENNQFSSCMSQSFFVLLTFVYTVVNVCLVLKRNHKAHQFFKTKAPNLPVLEEPNIFTGHLFDVVFRQKNYQTIGKLHDKLGDTFGYYMCEQAWVSTKNLDLLKLIELDEAHKHLNHSELGLPFKEFNQSVLQLNGEAWRRSRRAIAPALTNHKVRSVEVSEDIESIIEQLEFGIDSRLKDDGQGRRSTILDAGDMFQRFALAVIFLVTYRRERVIDFCAEKDAWVERIDAPSRKIRNPFVAASIIFPFARPLIEFLVRFHVIGKMQAQIVDYIVQATDIHRVAREQHQKIQRKLSLTTGVPEQPFSKLKRLNGYKRRLVDTIIDALIEKRVKYEEFIGTTLFLLLAGFQTTAETITCLVWQLARNPDAQEKLRDSIVRDGIDSEYLMWCIQETVRYHPAVPLGTGRVLSEDVTVDGLFLPEGTFVMPSTYNIHHDPNIWPEPKRFLPERWRDAASFHPAAFMGFGLGPRNCIGGKLAVHEIKLVTKLLLANYRIERCPETPDEYKFSAPGLIYTFLDVPIKVRLVELEDRKFKETSSGGGGDGSEDDNDVQRSDL